MKKAKASLLVAVAALALAGFAVAGPASAQSTSWTKEECESKQNNGLFLNGDCYYQQAPVPLGVSIGGLTQATLSQYLAAAYRVGLGVAAVLAVIFIMIGGFRYLASAGGAGIEEGKGMIKNALVGLILSALSFTLLQTINPQLTTLQLPMVKMVHKTAISSAGSGGSGIGMGDACWTGSEAEACKQACPRCVCKKLQDPPAAKIVEDMTGIAISIGALPALAAQGAAAAAGNAAIKILGWTKDAVWTAAKVTYAAGAALTGSAAGGAAAVGAAGAGGAYVIDSALWGDDSASKGERGICMPFADHDIPKGQLCSYDDGCISGKCFITDKSLAVGVCVVKDGTLDSFCEAASDCTKVTGQAACVTTVDPIKKCTDGQAGSPCGRDSDCLTGGLCSNYVCGAGAGNAGTGAKCVSSSECAEGNCAKAAGAGTGICVTGRANSVCYRDGDCAGSPGLVCASACQSTESCQGRCISPIAGGYCFYREDCPSGSSCVGASPGEAIAGECK